jgi:hypothetical protein
MLLIKINWQFIWLGGCCLRVVVSLHSAFLKIRCFLWGLLLNFNWSIQRGKCYIFQCTWLRTFSIHEHTVCSTRMCCLKIEIFDSIQCVWPWAACSWRLAWWKEIFSWIFVEKIRGVDIGQEFFDSFLNFRNCMDVPGI